MNDRFKTIISLLIQKKKIEQEIDKKTPQPLIAETTIGRIFAFRQKLEIETALADFHPSEIFIAQALLAGSVEVLAMQEHLQSVKKHLKFQPKKSFSPGPVAQSTKKKKIDDEEGWLLYIVAVLAFCHKHKVDFVLGMALLNRDDVLIGFATDFDVLTNFQSVVKKNSGMI